MIARRLAELAPQSGTPSTKARLRSCAIGIGETRSVLSKRASRCSGVRVRRAVVDEVGSDPAADVGASSVPRAVLTAVCTALAAAAAALRSDPVSNVGSFQLLLVLLPSARGVLCEEKSDGLDDDCCDVK